MSFEYNKTVWVNDETPINEENLNKIENQLEFLTEFSESVNNSIGNIESSLDHIIDIQEGLIGGSAEWVFPKN